MRRSIAIALLLLPALALGTGSGQRSSGALGDKTRPAGNMSHHIFPASSIGQLTADYDTGFSGTYFLPDANTVMWCRAEDFASNTLTCSTGGAWTTTGTVTTSTMWWYPAGIANAARLGLNFTDSNYFTKGSGSDVMDFTGDYTVCFALQMPPLGGNTGTPLDNHTGTTFGYAFVANSSTNSQISLQQRTSSGGSFLVTTSTDGVPLAINVVCGGVSGSNARIFQNGNASSLVALSGSLQPATSAVLTLGRAIAAGKPLTYPLLEMIATTTPISGTFNTTQQQRALRKLTGNGQLVSNGRSTATTAMLANNTLRYFVDRAPAITDNGLETSPAATNVSIRSEALDNAAWTASSVTVTANTTVSPDTQTTAETLAGTGAAGYLETTTGVTAATATYAASVFAKVASSTQSFDLVIWDDTAGSAYCTTTVTATTTWQRFACSRNGNATSGHSLKLRIYPGSSGTGTIIAWGTQLEGQTDSAVSVVTPYIATTATSVARTADGVAFSTGLRLNQAKWCGAITFAPGLGQQWGDRNTMLFHLNTNTPNAIANSADLYVDTSGQVVLITRDGLNDAKTITSTTNYAGTSAAHRFTVCDDNGSLSAYVDGAMLTVNTTGTGTGRVDMSSTTVLIGSDAVGAMGAVGRITGHIQFLDGINVGRLQ